MYIPTQVGDWWKSTKPNLDNILSNEGKVKDFGKISASWNFGGDMIWINKSLFRFLKIKDNQYLNVLVH